MSYEFSSSENETLTKFVFWGKFFSIVSIVVGAIMVLGLFIDFVETSDPLDIPLVLMFAAAIFAGVMMLLACASFKNIIHTEGNDITHLMHGIAKLTQGFKLSAITALVFLILAMVVAAIGG